jgi:hypothetical protein
MQVDNKKEKENKLQRTKKNIISFDIKKKCRRTSHALGFD